MKFYLLLAAALLAGFVAAGALSTPRESKPVYQQPESNPTLDAMRRY